MVTLKLGPKDTLYYEHDKPKADDGLTFVFVNALTGNTGMWQGAIGPALRKAGHGTLAYNFRGQADSDFDPGLDLGPATIIADLKRLMAEIAPARPVLVGLSIGGLFAARAWLEGTPAEGLVLINTLRKPGPRIAWINAATTRAMKIGGSRLLGDLYTPLLVGPAKLEEMRESAFQDAPYAAPDPDHGHVKLMEGQAQADWDLPYENLDLPTLVMTGLQDRLFYDAAAVEELLGRLPRAEHLTYEDHGHLLPAEAPEKTARALLDFADGLRGDARTTGAPSR